MPYAADGHTDSRIASLVMGYKPDPRIPDAFQPIDAGGSPMPIAPPHFSSDIRAAMQVVDQLMLMATAWRCSPRAGKCERQAGGRVDRLG